MNRIILEKDKIQNNIEVINNRIEKYSGNNKPKIIAVLKGNGYGMGLSNIHSILRENGIDYYAVTEVSEAVELRKLDSDAKILVLNSTSILEEVKQIVSNNLIATIGNLDALEHLIIEAESQNKEVNYHLKVDTGFGRFGFRAQDLLNNGELVNNLKSLISKSPLVHYVGTYSHFQESYANNSKRTREQFNTFINVLNLFRNNNIDTGMVHICNSSAFFKYPEMFLDAVRIGSAFSGRLQIRENTGLKRVGYFEANVLETRALKAKDKVGYSGTYKLKYDTQIAVVSAGYYDGLFVSGPKDSARCIDKLRNIKSSLFSLFKDENRYVYIKDKRYKVLGRVGMKNFVIDIGQGDVSVGDKVMIPVNLILANQNIIREIM